MTTMSKMTILIYLFLISIFAYGFYSGEVGNILFAFTTIIIISSISVYLHELGHYIAAKLLGNTPLYFIIGTTEIGLNNLNGLFKFKLFGTNFILNPLGHSGSVEGFTYMYKENRVKMSLICFAGPFANLLFGLVILLFNFDFLAMHYYNGIDGLNTAFKKGHYESYLLFIFLTVFFINGVNFILNLIPFIKGVDGWFILQLFKKKKHPEFNNINIHMDMEKSMIDTDSFSRTIEPIYSKFSDM